MTSLITILTLITCFLLIIVVLIQNSKGGGLSSQFSASNQVMGVKKTSEVIEKMTWGLAIALLVFSMLLTFLYKSGSETVAKDTELREKIEGVATPKPLQNVPSAAQKGAQPAPAGTEKK
jgi:preprotein translocase subunit SecG